MGDEEFRQELLAQMKGKRGPEHFGAAVRESEMAKAESGSEGVETVGLGRKGVKRPTEGEPRESAPGDALEAEHNHDHRLDRGPVTDGDARPFIASVVLGRQNEAETQRKKVKVTIPRSDPFLVLSYRGHGQTQ